jgi:hypothetical protein
LKGKEEYWIVTGPTFIVTVFLSGVVFKNHEGEILIGFRDRMDEKELNIFFISFNFVFGPLFWDRYCTQEGGTRVSSLFLENN